MALILKDRVLETSNTTGTGSFTLLGATTGFTTFSSAIGNTNTTYYTIENPNTTEWEVGIGTVSAGSISRDTVLASSTGSKVSFTSGTKNVFCDYPAGKSVYQDSNGLVTVPNLATNSSSNLTPVLSYNASNSAQTNGATVAGSYLQNVMQNKSGTAGASTNFAVSNDLGTDSTYYGEFGMNSSVFSSGTPTDYFSLNNGIYYSGHDGDITYGSGNGYKTFLAWGTTGNKAHVINASGAIGLNTNITGTTNFGTAGQVLSSNGSSATPTWVTSPAAGAGGSNTQVQYNSSGVLAGSANMTFSGTALTLANDATISGLTVGKGGGAVSTNSSFGLQSMFNGSQTGSQNVAVGSYTLYTNTSGSNNTVVGYDAMELNTTGGSNTAIGVQALKYNTTASNNTAVGFSAGFSNTTGTQNVAVGNQASYSNTTSGGNVSIGYLSLYANTASRNTAIGISAGEANSSGTITAIGAYTLYSNTTGTANTAVGGNTTSVAGALQANTTGSYNVAVGTGALQSNTTASNNTAVGYQAGYTNTTGTANTFIGYQTGYSNVSNNGVTALGWKAGYGSAGADACAFLGSQAGLASTGSFSTFVGADAGYLMTTGTKNTILGRFSGNQGGLDIRTASNYVVLSDGDGNPRQFIDGSGNVVIGGSVSGLNNFNNISFNNASDGWTSVNHISGSASGLAYVYFGYAGGVIGSITQSGTTAVLYNVTSDQRLKENIVDAPLGNIDDIKVRSFDWIADGSHQEYGMVAQELLEVAPYAVHQPQDPKEMMAVDYSKLVPMMIKEIQDLKQRIKTLEDK